MEFKYELINIQFEIDKKYKEIESYNNKMYDVMLKDARNTFNNKWFIDFRGNYIFIENVIKVKSINKNIYNNLFVDKIEFSSKDDIIQIRKSICYEYVLKEIVKEVTEDEFLEWYKNKCNNIFPKILSLMK